MAPLEHAHRPLVPVLVGPTAVGKTAVALALADRIPITIISADARQVYQRLDIGTAKPDRAARARVPHAGLDVVEPGERYGAGRCMDFETDGPGEIAAAIAEEIGGEVDYRPVETDGAARAARLIAELL